MSTKSSNTSFKIFGLAIVVAMLASCSGSSSPSEPAASSTDVVCAADPTKSDLGGGLVCADSGFRLTTDDFSFPNWAGVEGSTDPITPRTLISLFGAENVCEVGSTETDCQLLPNAQETLTHWTEAVDGGRCEGMAALSMRFFLGFDSVSGAESGAINSVDLKRPNETVDQEINRWWATQFVKEVQDIAAASRTKTPVELVKELSKGLQASTGYTIGIYDDGFGHAVTPYAVTKKDNTWNIHIYDNNFPGEPKIITVNESKNEWSYTDSSENPDGTPSVWSGSTGTFELTPMSVRNGPFASPFHVSSATTKGHSTVTLTSKRVGNDPAAGLLVTTSSGESVGVLNGKPINEVEGAQYSIGKGGLGHSLVSVHLPHTVEYAVQVVSATKVQAKKPSKVRLSMHANNGTSTHIETSHVLDHKDPAPPNEKSHIRVNKNHEINVTHDRPVKLTMSNHREATRAELPPQGRIKQTNDHAGSEIVAIHPDGNEVLRKAAPAPKPAPKPAAPTASLPKT